MLSESLQAIEFIFKQYSKKADQEELTLHLRETLHREIALNNELVQEAYELGENDPELKNRLLSKTSCESFQAICMMGLPLEKILPEDWSFKEESASEPQKSYRSQFQSIGTLAELVERGYHRLRIQQIRSELAQDKRSSSLEYLSQLLLASKLATAPPRSA